MAGSSSPKGGRGHPEGATSRFFQIEARREQIPALAAVQAPLAGRLRVLVSEHAGSPALPNVALGEKVLAGQLIAAACGSVSLDYHAPTSGTVSGLGRALGPRGRPVDYIDLDPDLLDRPHPEIADRGEVPAEAEWPALLGSGGILIRDRALAPFAPVFARFRELHEATVRDDSPARNGKLLILTLLDRDIVGRNAGSVLAGPVDPLLAAAKFVKQRGGFERAYVVHDRGGGRLTAERFAGVGFEPVEVPDAYPIGLPAVLARVVTGRSHFGRDLHFDSETLALDVETLAALADRLFRRMPVIEVRVSVCGFGVARPQVVRCRVGTPLSVLVEACGGFVGSVGKIVVNGLLTGDAIVDLALPVTKGTWSLSVLPRNVARRSDPTACIGCGRCLAACPAELEPLFLEQVIDDRDDALLDRLGARRCIGCGLCSYVCPSRRLLAEKIAAAHARGPRGGEAT